MPLFTTDNFSSKDIKKFLNKQHALKQSDIWNNTSEWYKTLNTRKDSLKSFFGKDKHTLRKDQIKILRLRLGHCKITHDHFLDKNISKTHIIKLSPD